MSVFTVNPIAIVANVEKDSPSVALPASIHGVKVQLTDAAGNTTPLAGSTWLTTVGNITQWGIQRSTDGGVTFPYFLFQTSLPFGSLDRSGRMPTLNMGSTDLAASSGDRFRLAILTDTGITLGAVITTTT